MTENKRFKSCEVLDNVIYVDDTIISEKRLLEELNENEQLKSRIEDYNTALKRLQDLADKKIKENEQLKSDIIAIEKRADNVYDKNNQLKEVVDGLKDVINRQNEWEKKAIDENEQLKQFKEQHIKQYTKLKKVCNNHKRENEQLKQNIGIILKYCREKGKYAMNTEEIKAHNILQRIVNKELRE